jgi:hypothetical protein
MIDDVKTALQYIDSNAKDWWKHHRHRDQQSQKIPIVFGGYSSGAHVAATVLDQHLNMDKQQQQQQQQQQPYHSIDIISILYLSGVLHVSSSCWIMTIVSLVALGEWPSNVPSPIQQLRSTKKSTQDYPKHVLVGCQNEIFGLPILTSSFVSKEYADILNDKNGTKNCSSDTDAAAAAAAAAASECILLPQWTCNHWSVLSSVALRDALRTSLDKTFYK